ncbi:MAG: beta-ketoacyl synthase N-terminal-like domain-containing protein, partial [Solirubrobacteraceae bacterium]
MTRTGASGPRNGVAITGMACRFPGAGDVDAYWANILGKVDATSDPPPESWDPDIYYDPEFDDPDRTYCQRGGYLGSLASFDPLPHGIPPVAVGGEPDQWLALQVAYDALADAGATDLPPEIRTRTAIILGKGTYLNGGNAIAVQRGLVVGQTIDLIRRLHPEHSEPELDRLRTELRNVLPPLSPDTVPGLIPNIIVGRIANRLDLMGPAYTVDAACASSLVAVQHAVRDLVAGDCDLALAGGSQVWMPVATLNLFCRLGALSRRQQLRSFDQDADGTLLGEGIGIVVLKRLQDAVRDGDRVYAVIRGVGVSSDGRGMSVMAPRVDGEELALRRAYDDAGVSPRSIELIEAHGTGTPVGDVTEVQALTRVFGGREGGLPRCALGSVKSMISHTIPAAGVAGLIKTALALHHRVLPPTLHCDQPNPKLELERTPFYINTETRPWIHGGHEPRRAGINAFGFGGINAHAVLEEFDAPGGDGEHAGLAAGDHRPPWETEVCVLEAESPGALADEAERLARALAAAPQMSLTDLAFTLANELGAAQHPQRLAIVASTPEDLRAKLGQAVEKLRAPDCRRIKTTGGVYYESEPLGREGKVVLVFPGEGAQYPNMLADLCREFAPAREVFDRMDRVYTDHPRGHLLSDWVFPRPAFSEHERLHNEARLMELDIAVESVLTANAAVHAVVSRLVGHVDAIVGHSSGEHSAAIAAGVLDVSTDARLAAFSHGLHASYCDAEARDDVPEAALLAIGADAEGARRIAQAAGGELYLAMDNCPHQVVVVGDAGAAARAREIAAADGVMCEVLPYDRAVHTPLFEPFAEELREIFAGLPVHATAAGLWSCTTVAPYPVDEQAIRDLMVDHWTSPVRFRETIEALHDDGARVFVEVGPRGNLTSFIQDILRGRPFCAVAADARRRSGVTQLNHLAAMLAVHDVELDLGYLFAHRRAQPVDWRLPATPAPPAGSARIPLSTAWPMLRLSDDALARVRDGSPAAPAPATQPRPPSSATPQPPPSSATQPPPPSSATPPPSSNGGVRDFVPYTGKTSHGPVASPPSEPAPPPPAPAPPPAAAAPPPPALAPQPPAPTTPTRAPTTPTPVPANADTALDAHLETMERFLQTSSEIMQAYLGGTAQPLAAPAGRPLVGTIVAWEPERELVAQRVVDPAEDLYLRDHTLGWGVSRADPELTALPIMPLAMSIEILAEAAACLLPELTVTGMRELRGHRWLAFDEQPLTLEVSARRLQPAEGRERVAVELRELGANASGAGPVAEAIMLLGSAHDPAPPATLLPLHDARPSRFAAGELYGEAMFHGPLWRGVEAVDTVGVDGALARLRALPRAGLLRDDPQPDFVLDPVVLDAAGQVIGFWAAERLDRGRVVFPYRLAALDLYGPPPPPGEPLACAAAIALQGEHLTHSDIEVLDRGGRCMMRLTGWEDKRFDVPDRFQPLTVPARMAPLSSTWPAPLAALPSHRPTACRRLDSRLGADAALWKGVWASRVLGRRERELLRTLATPEGRQLEWLGARTAAKEAVAELLHVHLGLDLLPAEIEILRDERGRPLVNLPADIGVIPIVSLAHTHGRAAALAALVAPGARAGIGIDVEQLRPLPPTFAEAALTADERALLAAIPPLDADEWVLRCWCAKEAAGKAAGVGLEPGPAAATLTGIDAVRQQATVAVMGHALLAQTARDGDLIVATT